MDNQACEVVAERHEPILLIGCQIKRKVLKENVAKWTLRAKVIRIKGCAIDAEIRLVPESQRSFPSLVSRQDAHNVPDEANACLANFGTGMRVVIEGLVKSLCHHCCLFVWAMEDQDLDRLGRLGRLGQQSMKALPFGGIRHVLVQHLQSFYSPMTCWCLRSLR